MDTGTSDEASKECMPHNQDTSRLNACVTLSNEETGEGANINTNTAMQSLSMSRKGKARRRNTGAGTVTKRKSDGNRCGDSTYRGRPPSTKVAVVG